jgi:myo-inositol-1(or 4)-monophosphatase
MDIRLAHRVAVEAAEAAGALLHEAVGDEIAITAKDGRGDVVTSLDLTAESCIVERIRRDFPSHRIIAEESGALDGPDEAHVWLVDPVDGSNNVAIGLHTYVVGIALCERGLPVLGVVHDPIRRQTWSAIRGRGMPRPAGAPSVSACGPLVAWTQGHNVARDDPTARSLRMVLESRARRVLQLWAPLVCWVMLARGAIDGFVGYRAEALEMPAGTILAREAGMVIRELDGSDFDDRIDGVEEPRSFVAGRPEVIDDLLDWARRAEAIRPTVETLLTGV